MLTEERRKEFIKVAKKKAEDAKIAVRNVRRDANEHAKKIEKEGHVSEDMVKKTMDDIQKITDKFIHEIDEVFHRKEKEILEV
jgi:ribosome recycling factor